MKITDFLWLSYKDLGEKKVRTALTVVMVVIGIAAIVALTSITAGVSQSISSSLASLGPTSIIITSTSTTGFTVADSSLISSFHNVTSATPILTGTGTLYSGNQNVSVTLIGVSSPGLTQLLGGNVSLYEGGIYNDTITPSAVIGHSVAFSSSGAQEVSVGQPATLKLGGRGGETVTVPIVGILNSHGGFIVPIDTGVMVPISAAELLLHKSSFNEILVIASNTSTVNSTATLISTIYGSKARVTTTAQLLSTAASITGTLGLLFAGIAGVSLLVAAIGIMNIMLISVYERVHEIGIMKSVGFKNRDVLMIFLVQALIIGFLGGVIGLGLGAGASYTLASVLGKGTSTTTPAASTSATRTSSSGFSSGGGSASFRAGGGGGAAGAGGATFVSAPSSSSSASTLSFKPVFPLSTIFYAILVAVIVSAVAGVYPAWRASQMEPIDALRQL